MSNEVDEADIKNREARARNALKGLGYKLQKTPARSGLRKYHPVGYMVVNEYRNVVVAGCGSREYQAILEDVEQFLSTAKPAG